MSLNIKSEEADRLVNEVSQLTGESKTQSVIESLRQRLAREKQRRDQAQLVSELLAIGEKCAVYGNASRTARGELLFDGDGLPK